MGLLFELREQGGGESEGREQIGGNDVLDDIEGCCGVVEVFGRHDAGIVDEDVEGGVPAGLLSGEEGEFVDIGDVEDGGLHAGVGGGDLVEEGFAAAGDDDLVAFFVECFSEGAADAGGAAGDEDGVAGDLHGFSLWWIGVDERSAISDRAESGL